MTNEGFLLKMQSWQRRLLREKRGIRLDVCMFDDGVVFACLKYPSAESEDGFDAKGGTAYPPGDVLESFNDQNAIEMDELIEKLLNDN